MDDDVGEALLAQRKASVTVGNDGSNDDRPQRGKFAKQLGKFTLAWRYDGADRAGRELWGDDARGRMVLQLSTDF